MPRVASGAGSTARICMSSVAAAGRCRTVWGCSSESNSAEASRSCRAVRGPPAACAACAARARGTSIRHAAAAAYCARGSRGEAVAGSRSLDVPLGMAPDRN
eukprot:scaffold6711_cov118-Isochrysis_galbana.AAC.9